jgi:hypothetical protein
MAEHIGSPVTDPVLRERLSALKARLTDGLERVDPHRRLRGRPVTYTVTGGQTLEVTFRDVPAIGESEVLGVKQLLGAKSFCSVTPQSSERLIVRFVVALA